MKAIVVVLDGCPVGWLGGYGNEWVATPTLDRLGAEGIVFDRHISDNPDPAAARRAWRTGRDQYRSPPPGDTPPDLLSLLAARGVHTAMIRANRPANDAPPEFYAGWAEVFDARPAGGRCGTLIRALPEILARVSAHPNFLLWIEIDRLIPPWEVPPDVFEVYVEELVEGTKDEVPAPWVEPPTGRFDSADTASWELLHRSFGACVTTLDADLDTVFDQLRGLGDAAWVVTSDYGFPLGEHGVVGPGRPWPHEESVHVPLILRLPGGAEAGRRPAAFTQPADLMPTLLGLFGVSVPDGIDGHDLQPLWDGRADAVRPHAVTAWRIGPAEEWAIRTPKWALVLPVAPHPDDDRPRQPMLFEKPDDRWEVNDLRSRHHEIVEELEKTLRESIQQGSRDAVRDG